jgi:hypothetical protein
MSVMDEHLTQHEPSSQKQQLLLTFYQVCWSEMTWRRNAGYRTIILGLGYCGVLLAVVSFNRHMPDSGRYLLATVIAIATLFGGGYLLSNYRKYMSAAKRMVTIESYCGAYDPDFLGAKGPLMPQERLASPDRPITRDPVCLWSVIAFVAGGLLTAVAIVTMR